MRRLNAFDWLALIVTVVGALNWGLIALFNVNVVTALFGRFAGVPRFAYILIGLSAVYVTAIAGRLVRRADYYVVPTPTPVPTTSPPTRNQRPVTV
jgi:uncharacterized protein